MSATPNAHFVKLASSVGFEATLHRVTEAIEAAGLTVFARWNWDGTLGRIHQALHVRCRARGQPDGRHC